MRLDCSMMKKNRGPGYENHLAIAFVLAVVVTCLMLLSSFSVVVPARADSASPVSGNGVPSVDPAKVPSVIGRYQILNLNHLTLAILADKTGEITLPFGDRQFTLCLTPADAATREAREANSLYSQVSNRHFSGTVKNDPQSSVRISFSDDGIDAFISTEGQEWVMDSARNYDGNATRGTEIAYKYSDLLPFTHAPDPVLEIPANTSSCELKRASDPIVRQSNPFLNLSSNSLDMPASSPSDVKTAFPSSPSGFNSSGSSASAATTAQAPSVMRVVRLLVGTDPTFRSNHGSGYKTYIQNFVNVINAWYAPCGVTILVTDYYDWTYDTTQETDIVHLLTIYRNQVWSNTTKINFDQSTLFFGGFFWDMTVGASFIRGGGEGLFSVSGLTLWGYAVVANEVLGGSGIRFLTNTEMEEILAHEMGHSFNGVHDQADPYFRYPLPAKCTLMGYSSTDSYYHWFSHGNWTFRNNQQRIAEWANANLHTILWVQNGGDYGSVPSDNVKMTNLKVRVKDLPASYDSIVNVQYDLTYTGSANSITLGQVYTSVHDPSGGYHDFGWKNGVTINKGATYHYDSAGGSVALAATGRWQVLAAYYYGNWRAYYDDPVYIYRYDYRQHSAYMTNTILDFDFDGYRDTVTAAGTMNTFLPNLLVYNFYILGYASGAPRVGDHVDVYWLGFNTADSVYAPAGGFTMYVACQNPNGVWEDFGHTSESSWVNRSTTAKGNEFTDTTTIGGNVGNPAGGDCMFLKSSGSFDVAGRWRFIPDIYVGGLYRAWYGAEIDITVNS